MVDRMKRNSSNSFGEMNKMAKEKLNSKSAVNGNSESLQSESHSSEVASVLRRSSREKHAPSTLVLSGGNSKSYSCPSTLKSMLPSANSAEESAMKAVPPRTTELKKVVPSSDAIHLKKSHGIDNRNSSLSQESSECDSSLIVPSPRKSSMMVTRFKRTKISCAATETVRPKRNKGEIDFDEPTMIAFKEFLQNRKFDALDESDVIEDTLSILKSASERSRSFKSELNGGNDDSDDDLIFEKCLQLEENYAIGQDLLKEIVANVSQTTSTIAKSKSRNDGNTDKSNKLVVDAKTVAWIRRATGIHRSSNSSELIRKNPITRQQETKSTTSSRIATRQHVSGSNAKPTKRNRGLDVMAEATLELEKDFGINFPAFKFSRSPHKKRKHCHSNDDGTKAHTRKGSTPKSRESSLKISVHSKPRIKVKIPSPRICTSLRVLDHAWRFQTKSNGFDGNETKIEYHARRSTPLHPQFVKAGIIHQLPTMNSLFNNNVIPMLTKNLTSFPDPSLCEDDDQQELFNGLEGPPAQFAKCEFFYSDIDREWYKENFVASLLGVTLDTRLLHSEWRKICRRCKLVPRRFSKSFIASELMKRNEYRSAVRSLQNKPQLYATKFWYNVYKPLCPGTTVRAYSRMQQSIQRGVVASYDQMKAAYLIEFEDESYAYEYCPDSDVASCGVLELLICKSDCTTGSRYDIDISTGQLHASQILSHATVQKIESGLDKSMVGLTTLLSVDNNLLSEATKNLLEEVSNYDAFLTLLEVIDTAIMRKRHILSLLADANTLAIDFLPFGDEDDSSEQEQSVPVLSNPAQDHLQWLHRNLADTNEILCTAMDYFQTLYGNSLLSIRVVTG